MTRYSLAQYTFGLCLGLLLTHNSIRALTSLNLVGFISFLLLTMLAGSYWLKGSFRPRLSLANTAMFFFTTGLVLYALLGTIALGHYRYLLIAELLVAILFFFLAQHGGTTSARGVLTGIVLVGSIQAAHVIVDRAAAYSANVNYLLMSLSIGLSFSISYLCLWQSKKFAFKIVCGLICLLCLFALIQMQSRAVFIYSVVYLCILPYFLLNSIGRFAFVGSSLSALLLIGAMFFEQLKLLAANAVIYQRMSDLIDSPESEPRIEIYSRYLQNFSEFYLTGYTVGETQYELYASLRDKYPHNYVLEFISELGILGGAFALTATIVTVVQWKKRFCNPSVEQVGMLVIFGFFVINFSKSFSIYDSSALFISMGLLCSQKIGKGIS